MVHVRFYTVMGELCAELTAWNVERDLKTVTAQCLGRVYRRIDNGGIRLDDLWLCIQDLMKDHCERGYNDDLSALL